MMPRKAPGHDSRVITYRTLPGSSRQYQRVKVGECTAWVQTNLEFDLEVRGPGGTTKTKPKVSGGGKRVVRKISDDGDD
jgi:hypothetical protein